MSFCDIVPPYLLPPLPDYAECSQPPPPFMEQRAPLKRVSTAPSNLTKPMELASWSPSPPPTPGQPLDPSTPPRRQKRTGYGSFRSEVLPPPAYSGQVQEETAVQ
ncbi:unnamed protein product [Dibothriocephalus latus]|uniref:Uncharacterized protein n=1 Tax=Dibothriocephalus latus TaxID=60516 RepID=A0A3P7P7W0_DIBLA|nr:unnamed protein product [Dibothriocephalus latus]